MTDRDPMAVVSIRVERDLLEQMQRFCARPTVQLTISELFRRLAREKFRGETITSGNVGKQTTAGDKRSMERKP